MAIRFRIEGRDRATLARTGVVATERGEFRTPAFLPVGTAATVKGVWPFQLKEMGYECVLANTYHLYLRPGHERIRRLGGVHRFMGWDRPVVTDSGGYQVFSLSSLRTVSDGEVTFRSHTGGARGGGGGRRENSRGGRPPPCRTAAGGGGNVRDRPGGDGPGPAQAQRRGDLPPPVSRIRHRRGERRGTEGAPAGDR